jgi:hypothetical protein
MSNYRFLFWDDYDCWSEKNKKERKSIDDDYTDETLIED